jgi:hypothetical protein
MCAAVALSEERYRIDPHLAERQVNASIDPSDQFFTYLLMSFWSSDAA